MQAVARARLERTDRGEALRPLLLLQHIPFHHPTGVCPEECRVVWHDVFVREQGCLSPSSSAFVLQSLQPVLVLNGHLHDGCELLLQYPHVAANTAASAEPLQAVE